MNIRQAHRDDFEPLQELRVDQELHGEVMEDKFEEYAEKGFLIGSFNEEEFERILAEDLCLILEDKRHTRPLAYIVITKEKEYCDDDAKIWVSPQLKGRYLQPDNRELKSIFVATEYRGQGLGSRLLYEALTVLHRDGKVDEIFSIVAFSPVMNKPSFRFHYKHSFRMAALSEPKEMFGIKDYQSMLLSKRIQ